MSRANLPPFLVLAAGLCVGAAATAQELPAPAASRPLPGVAPAPQLTAKAALLVDATSEQVLYESHADAVRHPASLTKLMTALLLVEKGKLDDTVTVSANAAAVGEATAHLQAGDQLSLRDLLVALLLPSGNDASVAAAEHISGSTTAFVAEMNRRAGELGLTATQFRNPHGLHEAGHVTSARDLARLSCEVLRHPEVARVVALDEAKITIRRKGEAKPLTPEFASSNRLLRPDSEHYWAAANGLKTGYTRSAGRCLAASATQDGWQLVCVVLGCQDSWSDAHKLLEWGFAQFAFDEVVSAGQTTARVHVLEGAFPVVPAVAKSSIAIIVPRHVPRPALRVSESYPVAPVAAGTEVGEFVVSRLDGTELRATLVATGDVPRSLAARLQDHLGGLIAAVAGLALLGALIVHGAVAKAAGARRTRLPTGVRGDREAGPSRRERRRRAVPRP